MFGVFLLIVIQWPFTWSVFLAVKKRFNLIIKAFFHSFLLSLFPSPVYLTYFFGAVQLSLKSAGKKHGKYNS